jgi:hypothetical protein
MERTPLIEVYAPKVVSNLGSVEGRTIPPNPKAPQSVHTPMAPPTGGSAIVLPKSEK